MSTFPALTVKARAKAIFCDRYNYPAVPFRSIGKRCFAWAMARARYELEHGTDAERAARDADALAESYGYDVELIEFRRDQFFWGTRSDRYIELPRHDAALKVAMARAPMLQAAE